MEGSSLRPARDPTRSRAPRRDPGAIAEGRPAILHWSFFPVGGFVAWEATTLGGRATYLFRTRGTTGETIRLLNRALLNLNFRREPICLPARSLEQQDAYRRCAIACRRLPELRVLRELLVGRASHTTPGAWETRMKSMMT